MYGKIKEELASELQSIKDSGLYKTERIITTPQGVEIEVEGKSGTYLNFCANNYLGLSVRDQFLWILTIINNSTNLTP